MLMRDVHTPSAARFVQVANLVFTPSTPAAHAAHGPAAEANKEGAHQ